MDVLLALFAGQLCGSVLHGVAVCCSVLQCVALCRCVLQCVCRSVLPCSSTTWALFRLILQLQRGSVWETDRNVERECVCMCGWVGG